MQHAGSEAAQSNHDHLSHDHMDHDNHTHMDLVLLPIHIFISSELNQFLVLSIHGSCGNLAASNCQTASEFPTFAAGISALLVLQELLHNNNAPDSTIRWL